jgi:glycerol-3-phosphate dehydrogenase subunit C
MEKKNPEGMTREIIEACADCDVCRHLMDDASCLVFPELYRLYDKEKEDRQTITAQELRGLVDLCNFCALCPCPNIRSDFMKAKNAFIRRDGLDPRIRMLQDVRRIAGICGAYPRLTNFLFEKKLSSGLLKKMAGIHQGRKIPSFPREDFPAWVEKRQLVVPRNKGKRKIAYFAGCTAQYLFPQTPKAAVEVLEHNGIEVFYPPQKCCGMPSLLEGDKKLTLEFAAFNVDSLCQAVDAGFDIVCSCPTCGYMLKHVLSEDAAYSPEALALAEKGSHSVLFKKSLAEGLITDKGYFQSISAPKRIKAARHTYDLGEYLRDLHIKGELRTDFGPVKTRALYYPPCHLREQQIGEPYWDLLNLLPGMSLEKIEGSFYCCGIAGIMGFKRDFHEVSIEMGRRLMERIDSSQPERLLSDCLSCRLQFNQLTPYPSFHPIEVLHESYAEHQGEI